MNFLNRFYPEFDFRKNPQPILGGFDRSKEASQTERGSGLA